MGFGRKKAKDERFKVEERKLQSFLDALPVPAAAKDADSLIASNRLYQELLGADAAGAGPLEKASVATAEASEERVLRADGAIVPCLVHSHEMVTDKHAKLTLVVAEDLTPQRLLQEQMAQVEAVLAVVGDAGRVLIEHQGERDLIPRFLHALTATGAWQAAAYWGLDPAIDRLRCVEFVARSDDVELRFGRFAEHCRQFPCEPRGVALPSLVWTQVSPIWAEEIDRGDGSIREMKAANDGLRSSVGIPVLSDGSFQGVIELLSERLLSRSLETERILVGLAQNFVAAVKRVDSTEELKAQQERVHAMAELSKDAVVTIDDRSTILSANAATEHLFGYRRDELIGQSLTMLMPEGLRQNHVDGLRRYRETSRRRMQWEGVELPALLRNGEEILVEVSIAEGRHNGERIFTSFLRDVTRRKQNEVARVQQTLHDTLSGLPNRSLLQERIQRSLLVGQRHSQPLSLMIMDLDRFKEVNETFGHHNGDQLLSQLAKRLTETMRESDTVARLGGDEFALLLPGTPEQGAVLAAARVLKALALPFKIDGQEVDITGSVGIAVFPEHGRDMAALMKAAERAMYEAKRTSSGHAVYEAPGTESDSRVLLKAELRQAIENDQLVLYYQPKVDLKTGRAPHVEALVRWEHPERGMVPPDAFIGVAEESGLIKPLTLWILNEALRQRKEWEEEAGMDLKVAVNFSARSLDMELVRSVDELLRTWETDSSRLGIEVTESAVMLDPAKSLQTLTALHDMGVTISIDDFGTGQSSLAYLKQLPVDEIKIDKSFVLEMSSKRDDLKIVAAVVDLGHQFDLRVVAEGVENKRSIDVLKGMGCDMAQGYYLSRPVPSPALVEWLRSQEPIALTAS